LGTASVSDLFNLRPANPAVNSSRGNLPYVDGTGSYGTRSGGWYPGDQEKGDIARAVFYMNTRWALSVSTSSVGDLNMFIRWNYEDPVDDFERQRNDVIYQNQHNRNPYVDHPELVDKVYGSFALTKTSFQTYVWLPDDVNGLAAIPLDYYNRQRFLA
jgi:endonuclease I